MWKDWLERTLTRRKAPVMLAADLCAEPSDRVELPILPEPLDPAPTDQERQPVEVR
jgi:hypothetical protein